jgi:hypothetical protein
MGKLQCLCFLFFFLTISCNKIGEQAEVPGKPEGDRLPGIILPRRRILPGKTITSISLRASIIYWDNATETGPIMVRP